MIVRFDSLDRYEVPKFHVCNPGSICTSDGLTNVLGCLSDTTDEELVMNFNTMSELSFRIYLIHREDPHEDEYVTSLYNSLQNRRLIFVEDIGYFVIDNVEDGYNDGLHFKDVQAMSCEMELQNKMLPFIDNGTYKFQDLLEKIVSTLPIWMIGDVNGDVARKSRTFEDVPTDSNVLGFLLQDMQDAYECIFTFDTVNRIINVHDQNNYAYETEIHLTKDDVVNSIVISESSEDLYTALTVHGDENLNISAVNPIGSNTIYNFDYYLDWMTPHLKERVSTWQNLVRGNEELYYNLNLEYYDNLTKQSNLRSEIQKIETQLDMYRRCKDNIVAEGSTTTVKGYNEVVEKNGGVPVGIQDDLSETVKEIINLIAQAEEDLHNTTLELDHLSLEIEEVNRQIVKIHESVAITTYFTLQEYEELSHYIYEGEYTDQYITVTSIMSHSQRFEQMKTLYDRAVIRLGRVSKPSQEFSIDTDNFLFSKEFEKWSEQLQTGCLINVDLRTDDATSRQHPGLDVDIYMPNGKFLWGDFFKEYLWGEVSEQIADVALLFLSSITVNYDDQSLKLTFGSRFSRFDQKALLDDFLGDIKKSANSINFMKEVLYPVKNGEFDSMKEAIESSGILTKDDIMASKNQEFLIDDTGILGRRLLDSGNFDDHQIKITSKGIVFTNDSWETANTALGAYLYNNPLSGEVEQHYGILANTLIGNLILSEEVGIYNTQNSITLDRNGFILTSDFTDPNRPVSHVFTIRKRLKADDGTEYYDNQLYLDTDGKLIVNGEIGVFTDGGITELDGLAHNVFTEMSGQILSSVTEKVNGVAESMSDLYEQSVTAINDRITKYEHDLGQYMTFGENGLTLGATTSEFKTIIDNRSIGFYSGDVAVSWVSGTQLYIPNAVVTTTLTLGKFFFAPREDGGFSLTWQGQT